jgi:outer membrane protein TolC
MFKRLSRFSLLWVSVLTVAVFHAPAEANENQPYQTEEIFPQLKPILEKAMTQSPQLLVRNLEIAQAEAAHIMTRSSLLPRVDGSIYYSTNTTSVSQQTSVSSKSDGLFYSVSFNQPLFQWGTLKAQVDASKIGVEIAQKNVAEAYRLLAVTIRQQFMLLIVRKNARHVAAENVRLTEAALEIEEERLRTGRISPGEIIGPRLAVDEARLGLERADADLFQTKRLFSRYTGQPLIGDAEIPDGVPLNTALYSADRARATLEFFEAAGVDELLPLQVLQAQIKQADLNYKVAKYRLFPKFSISATASQSNSTNASLNAVQQVGINSQNINLQAVWSIFDGFATSGAKKSALATRRSNERQFELMRQISLDQARDLERQLRYSARAVQLADTRRALAEDAMNRAKDNLSRGLGTQKDVDAATGGYLGANFSAQQQRADLLNRWAEFLSLTARDPALANLPARYLSNGK